MSNVKTTKGSIVNLSIIKDSLQFQIKPDNGYKATADNREFILVLDESKVEDAEIKDIKESITKIKDEKTKVAEKVTALVKVLDSAGMLQKAQPIPTCTLIKIDEWFTTTFKSQSEALLVYWMDKKKILKFTLDDTDQCKVSDIEQCNDDKK